MIWRPCRHQQAHRHLDFRNSACHAGLIKLLDGEEDLLAAVIGHEVAHAVARHSGEKLSFQLILTLLINVGAYIVQSRLSRGQQRRGQQFPLGCGLSPWARPELAAWLSRLDQGQ